MSPLVSRLHGPTPSVAEGSSAGEASRRRMTGGGGVNAYLFMAGELIRMPESPSRMAGALVRSVKSFSRTGTMIQPHGGDDLAARLELPATPGNLPAVRINRPAAPGNRPAVRINRPAVPGNLPAVRIDRPAAPGNLPAVPVNRSGLRFQSLNVSFCRLHASSVRQTMPPLLPATPRHEAAVFRLRRSGHRAALHLGFAEPNVVRHPRTR